MAATIFFTILAIFGLVALWLLADEVRRLRQSSTDWQDGEW